MFCIRGVISGKRRLFFHKIDEEMKLGLINYTS